ncbi:unnamed protein product [Pleuronectes platessa]|uniref:Uncharacterized protein n=1 Tax=Pleuronectes platessa TaxID=8262 RepID=A0A9N7UVP3_PLEPL|nr:unnamed protein product [Pleuronectes platessa]
MPAHAATLSCPSILSEQRSVAPRTAPRQQELEEEEEEEEAITRSHQKKKKSLSFSSSAEKAQCEADSTSSSSTRAADIPQYNQGLPLPPLRAYSTIYWQRIKDNGTTITGALKTLLHTEKVRFFL